MYIGKGKMTYPDHVIYEGDFVDGVKHGRGTQIMKSGIIYEGDWKEGKRHGQGVIYYNKSKSSYYKGNWAEGNYFFSLNVHVGKRTGQGEIIYPSGNYYIGNWKDDVKSGKGKMVWKDAGQIYEGEWDEDVQHGKGECRWTQVAGGENISKLLEVGESSSVLITINSLQVQNTYVGEYNRGNRHGKGCLLYSSGAFYFGMWKDNLKHGQGVYVFENGSEYRGEFDNDSMVNLLDKHSLSLQNGIFELQLGELLANGGFDKTELNVILLRYNCRLFINI